MDMHLMLTDGDPKEMTFLEKMKNNGETMKDTSFHGENFRRRSRYIAVFSGLVIAFAVTVVLNINTGNVHISVPKILRIFFCGRGGNGIQYYPENPPSENPDGSDAGRSLIFVRFLFADIFSNPIAGPFVLGISSGAKWS